LHGAFVYAWGPSDTRDDAQGDDALCEERCGSAQQGEAVSTRGALSAVEGAQGLAVSTIDSSPAWVERWGQAASTPSARPAVVAGQGQVVSTIDSSPALLEGWGAGDKHTECQAGCGGLSGAGGTIGPSLALVPDWEQIVWLLVLPMRALH
jgi:hypothetical protein